MQATKILMDEHRIIERVLECLERLTDQAHREGRLPRPAAGDMIEFFRHFADHCHHAKEEHQLFPLLESRGFSAEHGPTSVMRSEHTEGRTLLRGMSDALELGTKDERVATEMYTRNARRYLSLLREHIRKEDDCLFAMADRILTQEDDNALIAAFQHTEDHDLGAGCHDHYVQLANRLCAEYLVASPKCGEVSCSGNHRRPEACSRNH